MPRSTVRAVILGIVVLACGAAPGSGQAAEGITIKINGVDVTGLVSQTFEGCTVKFDSKGNLDITAPGYEIKKVAPDEKKTKPVETSSAATPDLTKRYYIFSESKNGQKVGDEYAVIVNDKVVKKFKSTDEMIVEDITEFLKEGSNLVLITAVKSDSYGGGSMKDWFRIVVGEGHEEDNKAVIKKTLHKFTRLGSDSEPGQSAYTLKAK